MTLKDFELITLSEDTEILPFECEESDLTAFLMDDAKKYLHSLLAVTYLFIDRKRNKTVAYFSLLNDKISLIEEDKKNWNKLNRQIANEKRRRNYPAVKIGRLAVSRDYAGQGIGSAIINFIKYAFTHGNRTGCRFITVDALSSAVDFYKSDKCKFNFFTMKDENEETRLMLFDLMPFRDASYALERKDNNKAD